MKKKKYLLVILLLMSGCRHGKQEEPPEPTIIEDYNKFYSEYEELSKKYASYDSYLIALSEYTYSEKEKLDISKSMEFTLEKNIDGIYVIGDFDYSVAPGGGIFEREAFCDFYYEDNYLYVKDDFNQVKMKFNDSDFLVFENLIFRYTKEEIDNIYVERSQNYKKQNVDTLVLDLNVDLLKDSMIFETGSLKELNIVEINSIQIKMRENELLSSFDINLNIELVVEMEGKKIVLPWHQVIAVREFNEVYAKEENSQSLDDYVEIDYADRPDCMRY